MNIHENIVKFFNTVDKSLQHEEFIKLTLSKKSKSDQELNNVFVNPVLLKNKPYLSFIYRYPTKDITKNYEIQQGINELKKLTGTNFLNADLFTTKNTIHLKYNRKRIPGLITGKATLTSPKQPGHDREKERIIDIHGNIYLNRFGILNKEGKIKPSKQGKYRQINKYIEVFDTLFDNADLPDDLKIYDMGSGKGYLTFALYNYLVNRKHKKPEIIGIEARSELVAFCNGVAKETGFERLIFKQGSIHEAKPENIDILIALHACDTATDDAIAQGIRAKAKIIMVAPCCHKQLRKAMNKKTDMQPILQFGILQERQAEIVTDAIRALIMQLHGYKVNVFEFISSGHTPKNMMISAVKSGKSVDKSKTLQEINTLKARFGIEFHYLEQIINQKHIN